MISFFTIASSGSEGSSQNLSKSPSKYIFNTDSLFFNILEDGSFSTTFAAQASPGQSSAECTKALKDSKPIEQKKPKKSKHLGRMGNLLYGS